MHANEHKKLKSQHKKNNGIEGTGRAHMQNMRCVCLFEHSHTYEYKGGDVMK